MPDPSPPVEPGANPAHPKAPRVSAKLAAPVILALIIAALYLGRTVLIPLALAVLITFALTPIVAWLEKHRLGRAPAITVVLLAVLALVVLLGWTVSTDLIQIAGNLPTYEANIHGKIESFGGIKHGGLAKAIAAVTKLKRDLTGAAHATRRTSGSQQTRTVPVRVVTSAPHGLSELRSIVGPALGPLGTAGIVIVFTIFMLLKREDLRNRVIRLAGPGRLRLTTTALDDGAHRISRYLLLEALVNSGYGTVVAIALHFIGVPHALLWGVLTAILRFIPYVGILIAASLPIAMAVAVFPGWTQAIETVCLFAVLEGTVASFLEPMLYGSHTGISSLAILVAAVFWTMLWGPVGLILSTPLTVCLVVLGRHIPQLKFLEIALSDEPALSPQAEFYQRLLAMDEDEVRDIAHEYVKRNSLQKLYEQVLIPTLALAEQDRHANALDDERQAFVYQNMKELIEDLREQMPDEGPELSGSETGKIKCVPGPGAQSISLLCVPARDDADEIVAMMLAQLASSDLSRAGFIHIGAVAEMIDQVAAQKPDVVCISALPPAALGQARSLSKRLRMRFPELKFFVGLWNFEGGAARAQERAGTALTEPIATTLAEAMMLTRQLASCASPAFREAHV